MFVLLETLHIALVYGMTQPNEVKPLFDDSILYKERTKKCSK